MQVEKPMTDEEIVAVIQGDLNQGIKFADGQLTQERTVAFDYYNGVAPRRLHKGSSGYRSLDVYDQVEAARAQLLETFLGNSLPIELAPGRNPIKDAVQVEMASLYVNRVLFTDNPGEEILDQVIFDSLMSRIGVVRVYWEEKKYRETRTRADVTLETLDILAADPEVVGLEAEVDEAAGTAIATVTMERTRGKVVIEQVRPEDLLVNTEARSLTERTVGVRITKRMSEWKEQGFTHEQLKKAMTESEVLAYEELATARNSAGDGGGTNEEDSRSDDPLITLVEAFATLDVEKNGSPELYQLLLAGNELLEKDVVSDHNIVIYRPIRVPHIFHGVNFVSGIIPTANAKTALTRGIIDHVMRTNNPRYTVLRGTMDNARELLENKLGGLVNINKPEGIRPLDQASLNPFAFQTIQLLDTDLQDTTGISKLSQGIDKDAVSKQNSRGLMQDMAANSQQRFRVMARRFASGFLAELAKVIYKVAQANASEPEAMVVNGQPVSMSPADWPIDCNVTVQLTLSPDQKDRRIEKIIGAVGAISQDPQMAQSWSYGYKRKLAVEILKLTGLEDAEMALNPEPPQPDPMARQAAEIELKAKALELDIRERQQKVAEMKAETERLKVIQTLDQEAQRIALGQYEAQALMSLEQRKQASKEANDIFEKQITLDQVQNNPDQVASVVSVNR